jgi:hypothetical protein
MTLTLAALAVGGFLGWELHKFYLRDVYKRIRKMRAKLRGK